MSTTLARATAPTPGPTCRVCNANDQALEGTGGFRKQCVDKAACADRAARQRADAMRPRCIYCNATGDLAGEGPRKRCADERACANRVRGVDGTAGQPGRLSIVQPPARGRSETPAETMIALMQERADVEHVSGPVLYGDTQSFPIEALQARNVVLGKSGCGKTGVASVIVENCLLNNVPVAVLDFLGNLWGIRARGSKEGMPIVIVGGLFGDVPLQLDHARIIAGLIAQGESVLVDLSEYSLEDQQWFTAEFFTELSRVLRRPAHIVVDEADVVAAGFSRSKAQFASQGAVTRFARQIRRWGVGWTFLTQRGPLLHPDIIDSSNVFITMQTTGDDVQRKIRKEAGTRVGAIVADAILSELGRLACGEAWILPDPAWLNTDVSAPFRFRFRQRVTHDSTAVPKIGREVPPAPPLVKADVTAFAGLQRQAANEHKHSQRTRRAS